MYTDIWSIVIQLLLLCTCVCVYVCVHVRVCMMSMHVCAYYPLISIITEMILVEYTNGELKTVTTIHTEPDG